jgi:hypothetical protein
MKIGPYGPIDEPGILQAKCRSVAHAEPLALESAPQEIPIVYSARIANSGSIAVLAPRSLAATVTRMTSRSNGQVGSPVPADRANVEMIEPAACAMPFQTARVDVSAIAVRRETSTGRRDRRRGPTGSAPRFSPQRPGGFGARVTILSRNRGVASVKTNQANPQGVLEERGAGDVMVSARSTGQQSRVRQRTRARNPGSIRPATAPVRQNGR